MKKYFDRHGKELTMGDTVRVQHCTGRYGQTDTVTGVLKDISIYGSVDLEPPRILYVSQPPGYAKRFSCLYPGFTPDDSLGKDALRGYSEHNDFEHGHTKFIEIVTKHDAKKP